MNKSHPHCRLQNSLLCKGLYRYSDKHLVVMADSWYAVLKYFLTSYFCPEALLVVIKAKVNCACVCSCKIKQLCSLLNARNVVKLFPKAWHQLKTFEAIIKWLPMW